MAIYRNVQMSFWTDSTVTDDYTPNDKLFYLYLLTNPHTNLCGCYEISVKQMAAEIGLSGKEIDHLIETAETVYKTISYSRATKEMLIIKWSKYNWTSSDTFRVSVNREIRQIKEPRFRDYLKAILDGDDTVSADFIYGMDTVSIGSGDRMQLDYTDTVTVTDTVSVQDDTEEIIKNVVDYLNSKCGTGYKSTTKSTQREIKALLRDGYTEQDFYTVIDKKAAEWMGTEQEKYLRPETLFGSKFEGYLNQKIINSSRKGGDDNGGDVSGGTSTEDYYSRYLGAGWNDHKDSGSGK